MKRIVHIIPTLDRAGAEKQLCLLAAGLPPREFDVHVVALTRGGPLAAELAASGVPVEVIGKRWKVDPRSYWALKRLVARLQPHLVHTWIFAANSYGRAAALGCGVKRIVAGERCVDPWKSWGQLTVDRWLARRTDRIVANSTGVRDFYTAKGLPADKFVVIPNGIRPAAPPTATREAILAELGLPPAARLVAVVGRLWPQKRIKDAIWAADLLKVIRDDVHLLVIGDGPQRDRLLRFRDQTQIADKVHFVGHRQDVARLLGHIDVFWSTSDYEGQPNSVMEAMAAGVPVVASDIAGTRDLVVHEETGYLYPVEGYDGKIRRASLARYTQRLLEDPPLARRLGEAGRARMLSEFSVDRMIARHIALYHELLE